MHSQNDPRGDGEVLSASAVGDSFAEVLRRRLARRDFLKAGVAASALVLGGTWLDAPRRAAAQTPVTTAQPAASLDFAPIKLSAEDRPIVAAGYRVVPLLRWGDPILPGAPAFDPAAQSAEKQAQQFGYNNDFVGFLPLPFGSNSSSRGLLVVNHEYTNPELMFAGYSFDDPTREQVDIELAAHGLSVVEIEREQSGEWQVVRDSSYNRRITATTPIHVSGPAAGHDWLKTSADPTGTSVLGTLNNCSAGKTPWGTVLSAEENFHQYFGNLDAVPAGAVKDSLARYGFPKGASERKWERFHERFDLAREPNEAFRHGWVVEVDPYDPTSVPVKRTSLGRFKHEAATVVVAPSGQVVLYSGDDERFEYVYKFVSANPYNPTDRAANLGLLDQGTLYVARFNDDGTGEWLALVQGQGPLTAANGFATQGDVVINPRRAADLLGATKMDRPEDIETNPVNRKVYLVMTNNTQRGTEGRPGTDAANPRPENKHGHIIELTEQGDDHAATRFTWNIFLLCGAPADESTYFAGYPKEKVSTISSPDNITFDLAGNLWIATDGQPSTLKMNDGLYAAPVEGPERGYLRQFFSGLPGCEICGPEFTPDNTSLFLAIQHPGEGEESTFDQPRTRWPDGGNMPPRPSVVVIQAENQAVIGRAGSQG